MIIKVASTQKKRNYVQNKFLSKVLQKILNVTINRT